MTECILCGRPGARPRMVEWAEPIGSKRFEVIPACSDVRDCRSRVELTERWPLVDTKRDAA